MRIQRPCLMLTRYSPSKPLLSTAYQRSGRAEMLKNRAWRLSLQRLSTTEETLERVRTFGMNVGPTSEGTYMIKNGLSLGGPFTYVS